MTGAASSDASVRAGTVDEASGCLVRLENARAADHHHDRGFRERRCGVRDAGVGGEDNVRRLYERKRVAEPGRDGVRTTFAGDS